MGGLADSGGSPDGGGGMGPGAGLRGQERPEVKYTETLQAREGG